MKIKSLVLGFVIILLLTVVVDVFLTISPAIYLKPKKVEVQKHIIITGHRGAACYAPENTLASIRKALELGAERIEVDIHQTKDGQIVIIHDETVDRTTNGTGAVKDLTLEQIKQLDAGSWFSSDFKGEKVPTLDEAFQLINGKAVFVIEIKHGSDVYPGIEQKVADLVRKYNAYDWVIVHSFDDAVLNNLHRIDPKITLHKLFVFKMNFLPLMMDTKLHFASLKKYKFCNEISVYYKFVNPWLIKRAHKLGFKINAWTVNDVEVAKKLVQMGVDGIISDCPDKVKNALK